MRHPGDSAWQTAPTPMDGARCGLELAHACAAPRGLRRPLPTALPGLHLGPSGLPRRVLMGWPTGSSAAWDPRGSCRPRAQARGPRAARGACGLLGESGQSQLRSRWSNVPPEWEQARVLDLDPIIEHRYADRRPTLSMIGVRYRGVMQAPPAACVAFVVDDAGFLRVRRAASQPREARRPVP